VPEKANSRRRPAPVISSFEEADTLANVQKEISLEQENILKDLKDLKYPSQIDVSEQNSSIGLSRFEANQLKTDAAQTTTSTSLKSTITPTTTMSTTTEPQEVYTEKLKANAGEDVYIYYPSRVCVLNGTQTILLLRSAGDDETIQTWHWSKLDSSPAFGVIFLMNIFYNLLY
jgi:hypothetical protein